MGRKRKRKQSKTNKSRKRPSPPIRSTVFKIFTTSVSSLFVLSEKGDLFFQGKGDTELKQACAKCYIENQNVAVIATDNYPANHIFCFVHAKPFACPKHACHVRCNAPHELKKHLKTPHDRVVNINAIVQRIFTSRGPSQLTISPESGKLIFKIDEQKQACTKCFIQIPSVVMVATHTNDNGHKMCYMHARPCACPQPYCNKRFLGASDLKRHSRVHSGAKPHRCSECMRAFSEKSSLDIHVRTVHGGDKCHLCEHCGKAFGQNGNLQGHIRRIHTNVKPHVCPWKDLEDGTDCKKRFISNYELTCHMVVHSDEQPFKCEECGMDFKWKSSCRQHILRHQRTKNWKFVCNFKDGCLTNDDGGLHCGVRCQDQRRLDYHIQAAHTVEGIQKKFKSEQQLDDWLQSVGAEFTRDQRNRLKLNVCQSVRDADGKNNGRVTARPDFYLLGESARLGATVLLENDESAHRGKSYRCDLSRTLAIYQALQARNQDIPVLIIRFNPHWFTVDGVLHDVPLNKAHIKLWKIITHLERKHLRNGLNLVYVNYDRVSSDDDENVWKQLPAFTNKSPELQDFQTQMRICVLAVH